MGQQQLATCRACKHGFQVSTGGGFVAQIVFCADCGRGESILHNQEVLGGGHPEAVVGICPRCSGQLRLNAAPRCPKCRSAELDLGPPDMLWD